MQKIGILNSEIAKVLADMGHTDTIVIGDCGLPVPDGVKKIDLALKLGTPRFLEVVEELVKYMEIEKIPVKCGVLSEDQLYDMIGEHNELLGALLDLTSKMYKNF